MTIYYRGIGVDGWSMCGNGGGGGGGAVATLAVVIVVGELRCC